MLLLIGLFFVTLKPEIFVMDLDKIQKIKLRYGIVGNYDGLNCALDVALQVAMTDLSVLITGENGVGKEVFPKIIHDNSYRKSKKYFAINCGSIPEGTIDSELFGHEKGAFTGAINEREGYFGVANGGTLFLDEVGELPLSTQARLLRVLETGEYIRVGASDVRKTDVRIVAATNVDIPRAIEEGKFRQDLYYRLNTIPINVPPLRERGNDICLLFRKFALEMSEKYNMPAVSLTEDAQRKLMSYSFPGNIRQLKNITENMSVTSENREINGEAIKQYLPENIERRQLVTVDSTNGGHSFETEREILYKILFDLRRDVSELKNTVNHLQERNAKIPEADSVRYVTSEGDTLLGEVNNGRVIENPQGEEEYVEELKVPAQQDGKNVTLESYEREAVKLALLRNYGKRKEAAKELGISERTLYRKIKEYGLE